MDFGSKVPPRGLRACTWKWAYIYPGPPRFHQSGRTMRWRHVGMYAYAQNLNSRRTNAKHELIISFAHPPNRTVLFGPSRKSCVFFVNLVWIENKSCSSSCGYLSLLWTVSLWFDNPRVQNCAYFDRGRILLFVQLVSLRNQVFRVEDALRSDSDWPCFWVVCWKSHEVPLPSMTSERHIARKGGSFKASKVNFKSGFAKLIFELVQILIIIWIENSFAVLPKSCLTFLEQLQKSLKTANWKWIQTKLHMFMWFLECL